MGASLIDMLLQLAITIPITYVIYGRLSKPDHMFMGLGDFLVNYVLPAIIVIAFWHYMSATPGKLDESARIVDADTGAPLSTRQSIIRYLGYYASLDSVGGWLHLGGLRPQETRMARQDGQLRLRFAPLAREPVQFQGNRIGEWLRKSRPPENRQAPTRQKGQTELVDSTQGL